MEKLLLGKNRIFIKCVIWKRFKILFSAAILCVSLFVSVELETIYPCDKEQSVFLNNAFRCDRYVDCTSGTSVFRKCAPGLIFDVKQQSCVLSGKGECDIETRVCPPYDDPLKPIFFPDFVSCNKYMRCHQGQVWEFFCREGQHWDIEVNRCDDPDKVNCDVWWFLTK